MREVCRAHWPKSHVGEIIAILATYPDADSALVARTTGLSRALAARDAYARSANQACKWRKSAAKII